jgi:hypothetical protein
MMVIVPMEEKRRGAGRPRKHNLMTPLRKWVLANFQGDYMKMAEDLGVAVSYLEQILTGAEYPGVKLAIKIRDYVNERTQDPAQKFVLDHILDYPREASKTAA